MRASSPTATDGGGITVSTDAVCTEFERLQQASPCSIKCIVCNNLTDIGQIVLNSEFDVLTLWLAPQLNGGACDS